MLAVSGSTNVDSALRVKIHNVFKFLQWKQRNYSSDFSDHDNLIVQINDYDNFTKLSRKCYSYTKSVAEAYTVHLWQDIAPNEYLIDGRSTIPTVSCDVLNFKFTSRKVETLSLSLLYPNNLLNSFLFTLLAVVIHHCVAVVVVCNRCFMLYLNVTALKTVITPSIN